MQVFKIWMRPTIQLHRQRFGASFDDNMGAKLKSAKYSCKWFFSFCSNSPMFENGESYSSWARHNVPILGLTNPPFSRWPWNPHLVRQSKLDNLFTYLPSCRGGPSARFFDVHTMVRWGRTACARDRFLGACFSSCMIMMICSGQVMGQACYTVKTYVRTWPEQQRNKTHAPYSQ